LEKKIRSVGIAGTGSYVPSQVLTNFDLEKMVDTTNEWIIERTGIRERRISSEHTTASDLGVPACLSALKAADISAQQIDLIIVATATPDMIFPSTACFIQDRIGASKNTICFDLSAACSGFSYALEVARQFIATSTCDTALVVGTEVLSKVVDWTDRSTCVLFGDGAGAAVLKPVAYDKGILATCLGADGSLASILSLPGGGSKYPPSYETVKNRLHYIKMKGREVFKVAVNTMIEAVKKALGNCGLSEEDISLLIPHQANMRIIDAMSKRLNIPPQKIFINLQKYGNASAASTIIALDEAVKSHKIKDGDIVVLVAFGGGLTWGATVIKWVEMSS
jgi:3-oxoacyl-[acyl-carrier-protein] synthase-3